MLAKLDTGMTERVSTLVRTESKDQAEKRKEWPLGPVLSLWVVGLASLSMIDPATADMPARFLFPLAAVAASLLLLSMDMDRWRLGRFLAGAGAMAVAGATVPSLIWLHLHGVAPEGGLLLPALVMSVCAGLGAGGVFLVSRLGKLGHGTWQDGLPTVLNRPEGVLTAAVLVAAGTLAGGVLAEQVGAIEIGTIAEQSGRAAIAAALSVLVFQFSRHAFDPRGALARAYLVAAAAVGVSVMLYGPYLGMAAMPEIALVAVPTVCALYALVRTPMVAWIGLVTVALAIPSLAALSGLISSEAAPALAGAAPFAASAFLVTIAMMNSRNRAADDLLLTDREFRKMRASLARRGAGRLLKADLESKLIRVVDAGNDERPALNFAEFFSGSKSTDLLRLVDAMNRGDGEAFDRPFSVDLAPDPFGSRGAEPAQAPVPCHVHILEKKGNTVWLALVNLASSANLVRRAEAAEEALAEVLLREERLLSVAAHEMRTPMSILSMLSEELDAGTPWSEIGPSFRKANGRMTEILDDLRVRPDSEHVQIVKTKFTLRELAFHLQETYTGPAQANGVALILALSQQSDALIESDYGRIFIALSKLVHNAIVHSRGTEITLSAFLTRQSGGGAIITWQVSDDGRGISPERSKTVFRPFDTDGRSEGDDRTGLGLYTAQRAIRAMGGELSLRKTNEAGLVPRRLPPFSGSDKGEGEQRIIAGPGATFVLKHPARLADHSKYANMEHEPVMETQVLYPDKTALLLEDNQIVGDITVARMRRLFGKSIWVERSDDALVAFEQHHPDLILVDQLLPGMLGSEFIRQIRIIDKTIPIVGITASTMGTECTELEAAGANYALEKPLSVQQLQKIAEEFFGLVDGPGAKESDA